MRTQGSVTIDRPIDEVFRLTNDDVSKWSIIVVENEELETTPGGVGSTFRIVTEERGQRMEFDGVVTEYNPPRASAVHLTGKMFDIAAEYTFEDLGGSTRVTQISSVHGKGLAKIMFLCCGWMMRKSSCKALEEELNSLKLFCETEAQVPG